jgi:nitrate reductase gamma subunit
MAVLGIVLIALAVLFGLGVSVSSGAATKLDVFGVHFGMSATTVYFLGAITGAALVAGLWLLKKGLGRDLRRRKEMRELRAKATPDDDVPAEEPTEEPKSLPKA